MDIDVKSMPFMSQAVAKQFVIQNENGKINGTAC